MAITLCVLLSATAGQEDERARYEDQVLALLPGHGGSVVVRLRVRSLMESLPRSRSSNSTLKKVSRAFSLTLVGSRFLRFAAPRSPQRQ